jgi:hypothetical protein
MKNYFIGILGNPGCKNQGFVVTLTASAYLTALNPNHSSAQPISRTRTENRAT